VVFAQNHDQVGNRMLGERLSSLVSFEAAKLAAGMVILSPFIPLLFMGEEWGEKAPFQYFISHLDPALVEAVRRGRRQEFAQFGWQQEPPDAQDEATFLRCKLDHTLKRTEPHQTLWEFYRELIKLRTTLPAFSQLSKEHMEVRCLDEEGALQIRRWCEGDEALIVANFSDQPSVLVVPAQTGYWQTRIDSADQRWRGPGSSVPERFNSSGETPLTFCSKSICAFQRME
jgi:maltooligosyltrehalose trehalohydrolase